MTSSTLHDFTSARCGPEAEAEAKAADADGPGEGDGEARGELVEPDRGKHDEDDDAAEEEGTAGSNPCGA